MLEFQFCAYWWLVDWGILYNANLAWLAMEPGVTALEVLERTDLLDMFQAWNMLENEKVMENKLWK